MAETSSDLISRSASPDQPLRHVQLEQFTRYFGLFGNDPFVKPLDGYPSILEICRSAEEKSIPFGGSWNYDWSFQTTPPSATILNAKFIPPVGSDTLYASGFRVFDALSG